jgi:lysophospholipase L1-like esterase
MRRFLPELIAAPLLPFLIAQGRYTRRVTPRLPEAGGPVNGFAGSSYVAPSLSLLSLGESPVAGVGVGTHEEAITGQFAQALSICLQRPIAWRACGKNGITAREAMEQLIPTIPAEPVDLAFVAFGVNDSTAFHSVARWRKDLGDVLDALEARCAPRLTVLSGVPPLGHFPALPQPLRWIMGLKAQTLDHAALQLASTRSRTRHVPMLLDTGNASLMAHDGYHPSAKGCAAWAQLLVNACAADIASGSNPR